MAVSITSLTTRFPEFRDTPNTLIAACISDAELQVDRAFYGARADMAVTYLAAHMIATNPLGEMARIDKRGDKTVYSVQFNRLKKMTGAGCRVI